MQTTDILLLVTVLGGALMYLDYRYQTAHKDGSGVVVGPTPVPTPVSTSVSTPVSTPVSTSVPVLPPTPSLHELHFSGRNTFQPTGLYRPRRMRRRWRTEDMIKPTCGKACSYNNKCKCRFVPL